MLETPSAFAPASKVSAATLGAAGITVQLRPPRPGGTGWVAAEAAGAPNATTAPAAIKTAASRRKIRRESGIGRLNPDLAERAIVITSL